MTSRLRGRPGSAPRTKAETATVASGIDGSVTVTLPYTMTYYYYVDKNDASKNFPTPKVVLDAVKGMDPRMGLCMDVGHSMRAGADVVQEIANAGPRLLDMHIKDLKDGKVKESQCDVGDGVMPVVAIFKQLQRIGYSASVNLEYEINADNPLPGMLHSFGYMKGVLAGLAG